MTVSESPDAVVIRSMAAGGFRRQTASSEPIVERWRSSKVTTPPAATAVSMGRSSSAVPKYGLATSSIDWIPRSVGMRLSDAMHNPAAVAAFPVA